MIAFLSGRYKERIADQIIIECAGIGYEVTVTDTVMTNLPIENEEIKIPTYMVVKEDEMSLYGFGNNEEKNMFLKLITVSGVGAKSAIQILSNVRFIDLITAIVEENHSFFNRIKGIGKKTAERIILELRDKFNPMDYMVDIGGMASEHSVQPSDSAISDAVIVLTSLGIRQADAMRIAREQALPDDTAENIVGKVLRTMGA